MTTSTNLFDNSVASNSTPSQASTLFSDEQAKYNAMLSDGLSNEKAREVISYGRGKLLKTISSEEANTLKQMAADGLDSTTAVSVLKKIRNNNLPLWKKAVKIPFDASVGALSLATEQTGNLLDFATGGKGDFKEQVEGVKEVTDRSFADSTAFQAGRKILGTGELLAVTPTKLASSVGGRAAQGAGIGAGVSGGETILNKGSDATLGEIGTNAAIGGAFGGGLSVGLDKGIPLIAKTISKMKNFKPTGKITEGITNKVTRDLPEAVVKRDLGFTPTERKNIESILGKSEGKYVLEKGLGGQGKEEMAEFFAKNADEQYQGITKKLANTTDVVESESGKQALEDIVEQLSSSKKLANAYKDDIIAAENMLNKGKYTGSELNNIRRAYDKVNTGMYTVAGKAKAGVENAIDLEVRKNLNNEIESIAKKAGFSVKDMNKELRASLTMKDALLRRFSQEQKNNFLGLQDLGVSAILSGGNPLQAVGIIGAKKLAEDAAPGLSQKLYNLNTKKDVVSKTVRRGNTINNGTKSSKLGLSSNPVSDVSTKAEQGQGAIKKSIENETRKEVLKEEKVLSDLKDIFEKLPNISNTKTIKEVSNLTKDIKDVLTLTKLRESIEKSNIAKKTTILKVIDTKIKQLESN